MCSLSDRGTSDATAFTLPLMWIDILRSALFAHDLWDFSRVPSQEVHPDPEEHAALARLRERMTAEILPLYASMGVALDPKDNPAVFARRSTLTAALSFTPAELAIIHRALELAEREFAGNMYDFSLVTPGGISWYPVTDEDLQACREAFGRFLAG